jgi:hypothetical protein
MTIKGGGLVPNFEYLTVIGTMIMYGLFSIVIGPLYLLTELINAPVTSINNLSRKAFKKEKGAIWHKSFSQLLFNFDKTEMNNNDFLLEKDIHIHQKVAIVSNDEDPDPEVDDEGKRLVDSNGNPKQKAFLDEKDYSPGFIDKINYSLSSQSDYQKLKYNVFRLFDKIESLRKTDAERKNDIHLYIKNIKDYKSLIKWFLIYNTINTCEKYKNEKKTILKGIDVVTIVNPFYHPASMSYTNRLECIKKHLFQDELRKDNPEDKICRVCCDTCTFKNSISRLTQKYISSGAWLLALVAISTGLVGVSSILASTGLTSGLGVASGVVSTVGVGANAVGANAAGAVTATAVSTASGIGATASGIISMISGCLTGGAGVLVAGAGLYNIYVPPNYSGIVQAMLNSYFKHIKMTNTEFLNNKEKINAIPSITYEIENSKTEKSVTSNIINILKKITVTSTFKADTEEKKAVIDRFNRFMCKYEIDKMIEVRIAQLYEKELNKNKVKNPVEVLDFLSTEPSTIIDNLSNVVQKTKNILTTSLAIEEKTKK